jgi:hypothetical protein
MTSGPLELLLERLSVVGDQLSVESGSTETDGQPTTDNTLVAEWLSQLHVYLPTARVRPPLLR